MPAGAELIEVLIHVAVCGLAPSVWSRVNGHGAGYGIRPLKDGLSLLAAHYGEARFDVG